MKGQSQLSWHLLATRESRLSANTIISHQRMKLFVEGKYYRMWSAQRRSLVIWWVDFALFGNCSRVYSVTNV